MCICTSSHYFVSWPSFVALLHLLRAGRQMNHLDEPHILGAPSEQRLRARHRRGVATHKRADATHTRGAFPKKKTVRHGKRHRLNNGVECGLKWWPITDSRGNCRVPGIWRCVLETDSPCSPHFTGHSGTRTGFIQFPRNTSGRPALVAGLVAQLLDCV